MDKENEKPTSVADFYHTIKLSSSKNGSVKVTKNYLNQQNCDHPKKVMEFKENPEINISEVLEKLQSNRFSTKEKVKVTDDQRVNAGKKIRGECLSPLQDTTISRRDPNNLFKTFEIYNLFETSNNLSQSNFKRKREDQSKENDLQFIPNVTDFKEDISQRTAMKDDLALPLVVQNTDETFNDSQDLFNDSQDLFNDCQDLLNDSQDLFNDSPNSIGSEQGKRFKPTVLINREALNMDLSNDNDNNSNDLYAESTVSHENEQFTQTEDSVNLIGNLTPAYKYNENCINLRDAFTNVNKIIKDFDNQTIIWYENMDLELYMSQMSQKEENELIVISETNTETNNSNISAEIRINLRKLLDDKELLLQESIKLPVFSEKKKVRVLTTIRNIFTELSQNLDEKKKLVLKVRKMNDWKNVVFLEDKLQFKPKETVAYSSMIKSSKKSEHKFCLMIYLLIKIYNLVYSNSMCTKREIYYEIVNFVKDQQEINTAVDTIGCMLDLPQWDLGVMSCSKGLIYGDVEIQLKSSETIRCLNRGGTLILNDLRNITKIQSNASFILVVEKEAIFQKLLDEDIYNKFFYKFILITGKGYPDFSTRLLTRILTGLLKIPVFIFVDADPHGIDIMLTYRYGSLSTCFMSKEIAIPNIKWIGLHPSEMDLMEVKQQPLTDNDIKKLKDILTRPYLKTDSKIKHEINTLLVKNKKAEIEGLIQSKRFLGAFYLPNKLNSRDFF